MAVTRRVSRGGYLKPAPVRPVRPAEHAGAPELSRTPRTFSRTNWLRTRHPRRPSSPQVALTVRCAWAPFPLVSAQRNGAMPGTPGTPEGCELSDLTSANANTAGDFGDPPLCPTFNSRTPNLSWRAASETALPKGRTLKSSRCRVPSSKGEPRDPTARLRVIMANPTTVLKSGVLLLPTCPRNGWRSEPCRNHGEFGYPENLGDSGEPTPNL